MVATPAKNQYVAIIESDCAYWLLDGQHIALDLTWPEIKVNSTFSTVHLSYDGSIPLPSYLEVRLEAETELDLRPAGSVIASKGRLLVDLFAVAANAYANVADPIYLAVVTPGVSPRPFFQARSKIPARSVPFIGRKLNREAASAFAISALDGEDNDVGALTRAVEQYTLALRYLTPDTRTLAVAHLFIAAENLKLMSLKRLGFDNTYEELAQKQRVLMDLKPFSDNKDMMRAAENYIRHNAVFHGDVDGHKAARFVSEGFEHGFREFHKLHDAARDSAVKIAGHVRQAIVELSHVAAVHRDHLLSQDYSEPISFYPTIHAFGSFREEVTKGDEWRLPLDLSALKVTKSERNGDAYTFEVSSNAVARADLAGPLEIRVNPG